MKKALVVLILAALVLPVFADDALVLPKGVIRVSVPMSYGFADKAYNEDGDAKDISSGFGTSDGVSYLNLGLAVEYGLNDWITPALQWTPGWNLTSTMGFDKVSVPASALGITAPPGTMVPLYFDQAEIGSFFDIFLGAKMLIVGDKAPVPNKQMRFAVAPGLKIPLPGASAADKKPSKNEAFVVTEPDYHLWGLGLRLYYDYLVNPIFFVNLYSEFIYYPEQKIKDGVNYADDVKVAVGYDFTLELEPQVEIPIANGSMRFKAGVPVSYKMSPDVEVDGNKVDDSASYILTTTPRVGLFLLKTFMPIELEAGYRIPLMGKNETVMNVVYLMARFYAKF